MHIDWMARIVNMFDSLVFSAFMQLVVLQEMFLLATIPTSSLLFE